MQIRREHIEYIWLFRNITSFIIIWIWNLVNIIYLINGETLLYCTACFFEKYAKKIYVFPRDMNGLWRQNIGVKSRRTLVRNVRRDGRPYSALNSPYFPPLTKGTGVGGIFFHGRDGGVMGHQQGVQKAS